MTDPRRPVYRPDHDTQAVIRQMVNHFLTEATSVGCKAIDGMYASLDMLTATPEGQA